MVGEPFALPNSGESIKYTVGNPMGFYSSWNSFTLAHHFIVYAACEEAKVD
jgi:hypothetical protein